MKTMNYLIHWLSTLGIELKFLLNGIIGAVILSIYKKTPFWESIRQIIIGSISAAYFTPFLIERLNLSTAASNITAYIVGLTGMNIIDFVIKKVIVFCKKFSIFYNSNSTNNNT